MKTRYNTIISDKPIVEAMKDLLALTESGYIEADFKDIEYVVNSGNSAVITSVIGVGPKRVVEAVEKLKDSLIWKDYRIGFARRLILKMLCSKDSDSHISSNEIFDITKLTSGLPNTVDVKWAIGNDPSLGDRVKLIVFASGLDTV